MTPWIEIILPDDPGKAILLLKKTTHQKPEILKDFYVDGIDLPLSRTALTTFSISW
jgi:hypothetical protein